MKTVSGLHFTNPATAVTAIFVVLIILFSPASARSNWWQKGIDLLKSPAGTTAVKQALTSEEIAAGLKDALRVGSETVVAQVGALDGFNLDPAIHIPLPRQLDTVKSLLGKVGMSPLLDELELKLNRAAETATPKAKAIFAQAITEMTFEDVMKIYKGPDDAATRYFQEKMTPALAGEMKPIVEESLASLARRVPCKEFQNLFLEIRSFPWPFSHSFFCCSSPRHRPMATGGRRGLTY